MNRDQEYLRSADRQEVTVPRGPYASSYSLNGVGHLLSGYVGVGLLCSLLLAVVICAIFQYCKEKFRHETLRPSMRASSRQNFATALAHLSTEQHAHTRKTDVPLHLSCNCASHLTSAFYPDAAHQVAWYDVALNTPDTICREKQEQSNHTWSSGESVIWKKYDRTFTLKADCESQKDIQRYILQYDDTESNNSDFHDCCSNDHRNIHNADTNDETVLIAGVTTDRIDEDGKRNEHEFSSCTRSIPKPVQSGVNACDPDKTPPSSTVRKVAEPPLKTVTSDLNRAEESNDDRDCTKGLGDSSYEPDDIVTSDESFSRLQDVKAQAEFSPYHITWSTPHPPHRRDFHPYHSDARCAARALSLEMVCGPDCTSSRGEIFSDVDESVSALKSAKVDSSNSIGSSFPHIDHWGFFQPEVGSTERCTPRLPSIGNRRDRVRTQLDASIQLLHQEQQSLPSSSSAEHLGSWEFKSAGRAAFDIPKEPTKRRSGYESSFSTASSCTCISPDQSQPAFGCLSQVAVQASPVPCDGFGEFTDLDQTPQNSCADVCSFLELDNTFKAYGDIHQNSEGHENDAATPITTNQGLRHAEGTEESPCHGLSKDNRSYADCSDIAKIWVTEYTIPHSAHLMRSEASLDDSWTPEDMSVQSVLEDVRGLYTSVVKPLPAQSALRPSEQLIKTPFDRFKTPFPVDKEKPLTSCNSNSQWENKTSAVPGVIFRSKSSINKPLSHHSVLDTRHQSLRRSRTLESVRSSSQNPQRLRGLNADSQNDVSVTGSSASRLSLTWDSEFSSSIRDPNDTMSWDDDFTLS